MKRLGLIAATAVLALSLAGCAPTPVGTPITMSSEDLQGKTVELPLNSLLNITTGDLAVDSYTAEIADPSIAEFVQGRTDGSATFNPGIKPLKAGTTEVTLTNEQGGIQAVTFTVNVTG
ncbi:MAG: hypothetical protein ABJB03_11735 [Rhodoglobus sp.]